MTERTQEITSRQNERIKQLVKLRQRKERERQGVFCVEGFLEFERALNAGRLLEGFYYCADYFRSDAYLALLERVEALGCPLFCLPPSVFDKISYRDGADGVLGVFKSWSLGLDTLALSECPLLVVAESIEKPGNLGSLIRSAEAVNADALIVCDPVTDVFNPNVVRASRGLMCARQIALAKPEEVVAYLETKGIQSVALMPEGDACFWDVDWKKPSAVVAGSEWAGLSAFWESRANVKARLPMAGAGDSLNVSVATAVTLYEAVRQRSV